MRSGTGLAPVLALLAALIIGPTLALAQTQQTETQQTTPAPTQPAAPATTPAAPPSAAGPDLEPPSALPAPADTKPAPEEASASIDYDAWDKVANRAEDVIDTNEASTPALESLRSELADWRAKLQEAQSANGTRVDTLNAQIEALGPAPEPPATEQPEIADRRAQLDRELTRLEAPRKSAGEAYSRADGLIRQIDSRIRERQTSELLQLGPTPLNPANWSAAAVAVSQFVEHVYEEVQRALQSAITTAELRDRLPVILPLILFGLIVLIRGLAWSEKLTDRVMRRLSSAAGGAAGFLLSMGDILLPVAGMMALWSATLQSGLLGLRGITFVNTLPLLAILYFSARWLAMRVFPREAPAVEIAGLPRERRTEARVHAGLLGLTLWAIVAIRLVGRIENWPAAAQAVLQFPVLVVAGLSIARLGQLLERGPAERETGEASSFRRRLVQTIGRIAIVIGLAGPVLAAIGYQAAASFLTVPAALSMALIALLVLLQAFGTRLYALLTGRDEEEVSQALMPVLFGLFLAVVSAPLFALIWGARISDLTELWTRVSAGFTLGGTHISPSMGLTFVVVFGVGFMATRLLQGTLRSAVLPKTHIDPGGQTAIVSGLGYIGILLAALAAITATGIDLSALALVFGALSVGLGFGLQNIVQNFISGIIMLVERPVAEGDWIEVGGNMGIVKQISVRSTRIQTFDRTEVIVPNGEFITGIVTNWTRGNLTGRVIIDIGVAYGTDTRRVDTILREIAEAHPLVTLNPPPSVTFEGFGASSLDFRIRAIIRDVNFGLATKSEIHHQIAERFAAEGIEIPFPQQDIWFRNPETMRQQARPAAVPPAPAAVPDDAVGSTPPVLPSAPPQPAEPEQSPPAIDDPAAESDQR